MLRRRLRGAAAAMGLAAALTAVSVAPADADMRGCPSGWACIYTYSGHYDYRFYYYGTYNLHNEYGLKLFCNMQTDHAVFRLYRGYNGTGASTVVPAGSCYPGDSTPINSVQLATR